MAVENHERRFLVQGHPYWLALALVDLGLKQPTERERERGWVWSFHESRDWRE